MTGRVYTETEVAARLRVLAAAGYWPGMITVGPGLVRLTFDPPVRDSRYRPAAGDPAVSRLARLGASSACPPVSAG